MSTQHESEGFMSTPLEGAGARRKDNYYQDSEDNEVRFQEADKEYQRLKADFARIARARRTSPHSRSDSSKSPSPLGRQPQRRSSNLPKFRIATFYATDVEHWFNQIETQFALHQINNDDERYSLTCAALSGEVASDVRDVLLQPFRSHKYESLKAILIERRGLTTPERVNKVISGERMVQVQTFPHVSCGVYKRQQVLARKWWGGGEGSHTPSVHPADARFNQSSFGNSTRQCHPRKFGRVGRSGTGRWRRRRRE